MSEHSCRSVPIAALLAVLTLAACQQGAVVVDAETPNTPVQPPTSPPPSPAPLRLEILEPSADLPLARGSLARLRFIAVDELARAIVHFKADRDGDLATTSDQYDLIAVGSSATAVDQTVEATLPANMAYGSYAVVARISDGVRTSIIAEAPGRLAVEAPYQLEIQAPAQNVTVSRGGHLPVVFVGAATTLARHIRFVADVDGNATTTADQYSIATVTTAVETAQAVTCDLSNVPLGTYRILGVADNTGSPGVVATAGGLVAVANVAFATQEGGADYEEPRAIAALSDSSLVVTGRFAGSSLFGEWPTLISLNSIGEDDAFLARYAPVGALTSAIRFGGPSRGDWGNGTALFGDGSTLVGGFFHGLAAFDGGPLATGILSAGEDDAFLVRYLANGSMQWVKRAGGIFDDEIAAVATNADGSCVATGSFSAMATFGEGPAAVSLVVAGSVLSKDGFVARYHGDGSLAWVKQFGGAAGNDGGTRIATFADGSCTLCGTFSGTAVFGEGASQVTLVSAGGLDVFVARYDASGTLQWAVRGGGTGDDEASGIALLPSGSCYVCGTYSGAASFGPAGAGSLQAVGGRDAFVASFATDGSLAWIRSVGGSNDDAARGVAASGDGSCFVTGSFHTAASFGQAPSITNLSAAGLRDAFVARYSSNGSLIWARRAGGTNHDHGTAIIALRDGSCAVTGTFTGDATFGSGSATLTLTASGLSDAFIVRFNADGGF